MPIMYLADSTTNKASGVFEGTAAPAGTFDTGTPMSHGGQIWNPTTSSWDEPSKTWTEIRDERDQLIIDILWRVERYERQNAMTTPATTDTSTKYQELLQYIQDLRDIPTNFATPDDVVFPTAPL